jgi:hypothetical protein
MAILAVFHPTSTKEQFDELHRRLQAAGLGTPAGRLHHVAVSDGPMVTRVVDVWESPASLEVFAQDLFPILQEVGITVSPPEIHEIYLPQS